MPFSSGAGTSLALLALLSVLAFVSLVEARGEFFKDGFIEEIVASQRAMTGTFINNPQQSSPFFGKPMLLISSKRGIIHAMPDPDNNMNSMVQILDMESKLCNNGERGMQSMVPHPNFDENHFIYIFYTAFLQGCAEDEDGMFGPNNRLSRFKMDPDTLEILQDSEEVLLDGAPTYKFYHNGGAMKFGNDGKLYVTTGDGGGDAYGTSQDMTNLHGCLMRLNDDGSVPDDNPFTPANGYFDSVPCGQTMGQVPDGSPATAVCAEIFSYGLRNPFRIIMDPNVVDKTHFYINDVGGAVWEEISEGGTDFAGMNYGWPRYEGPCRFGSNTNCPLYDPNAVIPDVETIVKPLYYYEHRQKNEGGAVTGGVFVPQGLWPAEYKYIYTDFIFQEIYNLIEAPEQECTTCVPPVPAYVNETIYRSIKDEDQHVNFARIVDMFFGPWNGTQALYIFKMGGGDNIWRIRYNGIVNAPPVAVINVNQTTYDVNQEITFDGSLSTDKDDTDLQYLWDFDNGETSTEKSPKYAFAEPGQYTVRLAVTDPSGQEQQDSQLIKIGSPPKINITSPEEGKEFFVGEILSLAGEAFDGTTGERLNDTSITWEVRKHHADHWHPFLDPETAGNNFQLFPAPEPEDYLAATNSFLKIIMTATDSNGIQTTTERDVYPRVIEMCVDSEPQGLEIYVDEYPIVTPMKITSWLNHDLRLRTIQSQAPAGTANDGQQALLFSAWSDSVVSQDREIRLTQSTLTGVVAAFCVDGNTTCVETARAADTVLLARCPTDAPTVAPTRMPTEEVVEDEEEEEDFPVDEVFVEDDGTITTDGQEEEGEGDIVHEEEKPPEDEDFWALFDDEVVLEDDDDSAAVGVTIISSIITFGSILLAAVNLFL
eukprot:CAMPEP_0113452280 /NCGR_PEP_ID=MMETSP0014_2-20120614/6766_1 /TAXON_ID=2857 /ORGANISM="Nitzschia sp." /LENGTH=878 /DNA_ID=CAMNT_0000343649 /DNA_START=629 /DNA_END=3265 /DNA_ORIENTATION=- /assembly_acc=CAM_ASM_000159